MVGSDLAGKLLVELRGERVCSVWHSWLKEEGRIGAHFMMICENIGLPFVERCNAGPAFGELCRQPVPVEIEPVVVSSATRPYFVVLAVVVIRIQVVASVGVGPVGEALKAIGIITRIKEDYNIAEQVFNLLPLCGGQMIGHCQGCIGAAGLVAMYGKSLVNHYRHAIDTGPGIVPAKPQMVLAYVFYVLMV